MAPIPRILIGENDLYDPTGICIHIREKILDQITMAKKYNEFPAAGCS